MTPLPVELWLHIFHLHLNDIHQPEPLTFDETPVRRFLAKPSFHSEAATTLRACAATSRYLNTVVTPLMWEYLCVDSTAMLERVAQLSTIGPKHDSHQKPGKFLKRLDLCLRFQPCHHPSLINLLHHSPNLRTLVFANRPPRVSPPIVIPHEVMTAVATRSRLQILQFRDAFEVPSFDGLSEISKGCPELRKLQVSNLHCELSTGETWGPQCLGLLRFPSLTVLKLGNGVCLQSNQRTAQNLSLFMQVFAGNQQHCPHLDSIYILHPAPPIANKLPLFGDHLKAILFRGPDPITLPQPDRYPALHTIVVDINGWRSEATIPAGIRTLVNVHFRLIPLGIRDKERKDVVSRTVEALHAMVVNPPSSVQTVAIFVACYPRQLNINPLIPFSSRFATLGIDFSICCLPSPKRNDPNCQDDLVMYSY